MKPDSSIAGPYNLIEMPSVFNGRYYFDFLTGSSDPEGEYFALIVSPSENFQTTYRISLYQKLVSQVSFDTAITTILEEVEELEAQLNFITANVI